MLELGREPDLSLEPLAGESLGQLGPEHLDDHLAPQRRLLRHEHSAHTSTAELALYDVGGAECLLEPVLNIGGVHGSNLEGSAVTGKRAVRRSGGQADRHNGVIAI